MSDTILGSCYAAARKQLGDARVAQQNAVIWGMQVYKAGRTGEKARFMRKHWHRQRRSRLEEALRIRTRIRELRAQLRELEQGNTEPPRAA